MSTFQEQIDFLSQIDLSKKKILSIGSGTAIFEQNLLQTKIASHIDCIDKQVDISKINHDTIEADFIQYRFKKNMMCYFSFILFILY